MKNLTLAVITILLLISCNNNNPPQRVYVDGTCRGCGGIGYTIKACRCVRDPEGVGKQRSPYDKRDGKIKDCSQCVWLGKALYKDKGCKIGEIAVDCSICSRN